MKLSDLKVDAAELRSAAEQARESVAAADVPNIGELARQYAKGLSTDYLRQIKGSLDYMRAMRSPGVDAIAKLRAEVDRYIQPMKLPEFAGLGLAMPTLRSFDPAFAQGLLPRSPIDGFLTNIREQMRSAMIPMAELDRIRNWTSTINQAATFADPFFARPGFHDPFSEIHSAAERFRESFHLSLNIRAHTIWEGHLEVTRQKMSFAAGARDVFGVHSDAALSAQQSLLGSWRTTPDLPRSFWKDQERQNRFFEEADVDAGLIEATPQVAIELMIESGFAARGSDETTETISIGALDFSIRTGNQRDFAREAIEALEVELRAFIVSKLSARFGHKWFRQRAPGNLHDKAKANRALALGNGETETSLIAFLDLGDLGTIVTQSHNWDDEFGAVFGNRERFVSDMQVLASRRRPVAHVRPIHAVILLELVAAAARISTAIKNNGAWRLIAESDE